MRVLHVAHGWPPDATGGTELYAAALHDAQARAGAAVARWTGEGLPPGRGFVASFRRPEADAAFAARCAAFRPDLVHVHHLTGLSMGIPAVARAAGARVVVTLHDAWLACARGQLVDLDGARCAGPAPARCAGCLAPDLWAPIPPRAARALPPRLAPVREREDAFAALRAAVDLFLAPSRHIAARVGVAAEHWPLPLPRPVAPAPPAAPGPVRFLFLGALLPTKGPDLAVEAFARLPAGAATLAVAGPAPPWRGSTAWATALRARMGRVPGVRDLGALPPERVPDVLAEHDVLVFPSTWEENSPTVLREARAAGLRVVASDVPGAAEAAPDAVRVEPGSVEALRRALAAEVRVGHARLAAVAGPDLDTHARALLARYGALAAGPRPSPSG